MCQSGPVMASLWSAANNCWWDAEYCMWLYPAIKKAPRKGIWKTTFRYQLLPTTPALQLPSMSTLSCLQDSAVLKRSFVCYCRSRVHPQDLQNILAAFPEHTGPAGIDRWLLLSALSHMWLLEVVCPARSKDCFNAQRCHFWLILSCFNVDNGSLTWLMKNFKGSAMDLWHQEGGGAVFLLCWESDVIQRKSSAHCQIIAVIHFLNVY